VAVTATDVAAGTPPSAGPRRPTGLHVAAAIVTVQALVSAGLAVRGWFYQDDIDYIAQAADRPLDLDYLLTANNDHLTPGLRLAYWLMAELAPYSHGPTVLARVALQILATALFCRLLVRLLGWRPLTLAGLAAYAFTLLTLPSFLSLSSAVNLLPAHVAAILLLDGHVRFQLTGRLRYAVGGAAALAVGLLFWEKVALAGLLLPLLSLLVLTEGGVRERVAATLARWRGWLVYLVPVVAFFGYYLLAGYGRAGSSPAAGAAVEVAGVSWFQAVTPALVGGPWTWYAAADTYVSAASPPLAGAVLAQVALAALLVVAVRRNGPGALAVWSMPAVYLAGTAVVLAIGRYDQFGSLAGRVYHYFSDLAIPLVLAAVLSLAPPHPAAVLARCGRLGDLVAPPLPLPASWPIRLLTLAAVVAYAASFAFSAAGFERRWMQSPARSYVETLTAELRAAPDTVLYDTRVTPQVLTLLSANRGVSQLLAPLDLDVRFDDRTGGLEPKVVDDEGHVTDSAFLPAAQSREDRRRFCSHYLDRAGTLAVPLDRPLPAGDYFFRIDYISQRSSPVQVRAGSGGSTVDPVRGSDAELRAGLNGALVQTRGQPVDRLEVSSANSAIRLCVTHVTAGYPVLVR
jgi:hypothetical protein